MEFKHFPRVRSSLTLEGLALVIILGFIAVCSILRNVNLLVVVSGMMLLPMILCWRLSRNSVRNLIAKRIMPNRVHANTPINIQWEITNNMPVDLWRLKVIDSIRHVFSRNGPVQYSRKRTGIESQGSITFNKVPAEKNSFASYQVCFAERGIYELGYATIENRFPLGLIKSWFNIQRKSQMHVAPELGDLATDWRSRLLQVAQGVSLKSGRKGMTEEEFFAIREYRSSDNKRSIHWRSTAKLGQPMVKQYERSTEQNLALILDLVADSQGAATGIEFNRNVAMCESILSFAATVVSRWADQPFGQLCLAISNGNSEVLNSNTEAEFVSNSMRMLSSAQHGAANGLDNTLNSVLNQIASNAACVIISTRTRQEIESHFDSDLLSNAYWINAADPTFTQIFAALENSPSVSPEFFPE